MRAIVLALGLMASPVLAADQFDLVCKRDGGNTVRYRVDLTKGEACSDGCEEIWKMGPSTAGELKLIDTKPILRGDLDEHATVNRITGEYRYYMTMSGSSASFEGRCAPASFSGFPASKF